MKKLLATVVGVATLALLPTGAFASSSSNYGINLSPWQSNWAYDASGNRVEVYIGATDYRVTFGDVQQASSGSASVSFQIVPEGGSINTFVNLTINGNYTSTEGFPLNPDGSTKYYSSVDPGWYYVYMTNNTGQTITGNGYTYY